MSGLIPTLSARTPAEHQAAVQYIFDTEHEPQTFLITQAESDRVAQLLGCVGSPPDLGLWPDELIGLMSDGSYPNYGWTSLGRVWSRPRRGRNNRRYFGNQFISPGLHSNGYFYVSLCDDQGVHCLRVNHGVAQVYLANPRGFQETNHIDNNPQNNCVDNLEWGTHHYNILHRDLYRPCFRVDGTSNYRGVAVFSDDPSVNPSSWRKPFRVRVMQNGRLRFIGKYAAALEAAQAFDVFVLKYGIPTWLNFPD